MRFNNYSDNKMLIKRLEGVIKNGTVSHAYIFEGDFESDKMSFITGFVKGILCPDGLGENCGKCSICNKIDHDNHEDVFYVKKDDKSIKDAQITDVQERIKTKPFGSRNIIIISDCDTMTDRAFNRLLKTLEEPPGDSVIILLSENMENLPETILSRCVKYRINHTGSEGRTEIWEKTQLLVDLTLRKRPFYEIKKEIDPVLKDGEIVAGILDCMQIIYRDMLIEKKKGISLYRDEDIMNNILAVENARNQIQRNMSPSYAVKNLLLKIGG